MGLSCGIEFINVEAPLSIFARQAGRRPGKCFYGAERRGARDASNLQERLKPEIAERERLVRCSARDGGYGDKTREVERASVAFNAATKKQLSLPKKIFKIGKLAEGFQKNVRTRLSLVQKTSDGGYVYFKGVFDDGMTAFPLSSSLCGYDYADIFSFFESIALFSFVKLDISKAPLDDLGNLDIGGSVLKVKSLMDALARLPDEYWKKSLFAVAHSRHIDGAKFMECYAAIRGFLKSYSSKIGVGLHSVRSSSPREQDVFEERLIVCKASDCEPDFVTLDIDSSFEGNRAIFSLPSCRTLAGYGASQVDRVWSVINDSGSTIGDIYVTDCNILPGELGGTRRPPPELAFLRAVVFMRDLLEYGDRISGILWPDDGSKELEPGTWAERMIRVLIGRMKKPGQNVLYKSDRILALSEGDGECCVIACNPGYSALLCPLATSDGKTGGEEKLEIAVELDGMPQGRYRFTMFVFDFKCSLAAEPIIFEEDVVSTSFIRRNLGCNSALVCLIKRVNG
ncbi:MAG: hypothetical protein LBT31_08305 [Synergistaceae bacterium]|nr:hypothetical protein [Synergistaceae bacterium]